MIIEFRKPQTVSDLRRFLSMVNYYHCFVPNIAPLMRPLNRFLNETNKRDKREVTVR